MTGIVNTTGASSGAVGTTSKSTLYSEDIIGGTKRTYSGYESRTFLGSGSIYFPQDMTVDWFLVGGGGAGGDGNTSNGNGGGGAGGVVQAVGYAISAGSYNISIGQGALPNDGSANYQHCSSSAPGTSRGRRGFPSVFGTFVAHGGGGGSTSHLRSAVPPGAEGGCAGGGTADGNYYNNTTTQNTYSGTPNVTGYGYVGANAGPHWGGGGGGGAGGVGVAGQSSTYGHGGVGRQNLYETGGNKYFAGGGGGGGNSSEPAGAGSYGGGRGHGHCSFHGHTDFNNGTYVDSPNFGASGLVNPLFGTTHLNAFPHSGGGGGGGSYWSKWPQNGWQGSAGSGGSGYFVIRWAV